MPTVVESNEFKFIKYSDKKNAEPVKKKISIALKMSHGKTRHGQLFFEAAIKSGMVTPIQTTEKTVEGQS